MPVTALRKTNAGNVPLHPEQGLPGLSKRPASCAWCGREGRSIVELLDHIEAAHLDHTDMASQSPETHSTGQV